MNKPSHPSPLSEQDNQVSIWNRSLSAIISMLLSKFTGKQSVPETVLFLHNREMMDAVLFAKTAQAIDSEKFTQPEFLLLYKIKYCLDKGIDEYAGLGQTVKYLQAAIEAQNSYILLDQTELRYRSSKQQEFYKHIQGLLDYHGDREMFRYNVHNKLLETLPSVKTDEGKVALQSYEKELDRLSEYELGLKLFSLFKAYELADYSILRSISEMVMKFRDEDTMNSKSLVVIVAAKFDVFEKLGKIIGVPPGQNNPESYAKMLQYIALESRHKESYIKFKDFLAVMKKWMRHYQAIVKIRQEYTPGEYKQPKEFQEDIPGEATYYKYKKSLTDKRTGYTYFELEG